MTDCFPMGRLFLWTISSAIISTESRSAKRERERERERVVKRHKRARGHRNSFYLVWMPCRHVSFVGPQNPLGSETAAANVALSLSLSLSVCVFGCASLSPSHKSFVSPYADPFGHPLTSHNIPPHNMRAVKFNTLTNTSAILF